MAKKMAKKDNKTKTLKKTMMMVTKQKYPNYMSIPTTDSIVTVRITCDEDIYFNHILTSKKHEKEQRIKNRQEIIKDDFGICSLFPCRYCKSDNTTYNTKQTRSADEGMSVFATCLDCSRTWQER